MKPLRGLSAAFAGKEIGHVVAVEMNLVCVAIQRRALLERFLDIASACDSGKGGEPVEMRDDPVADCPRRNLAGPANHCTEPGRRLPNWCSFRSETALCRHRASCSGADRCRSNTSRRCCRRYRVRRAEPACCRYCRHGRSWRRDIRTASGPTGPGFPAWRAS